MISIDPERCPLCGQPNQCGVAAGKRTCWCFSPPFPPEILERIPGPTRDLACVCEVCAGARRDPAKTLEQMKAILRQR